MMFINWYLVNGFILSVAGFAIVYDVFTWTSFFAFIFAFYGGAMISTGLFIRGLIAEMKKHEAATRNT